MVRNKLPQIEVPARIININPHKIAVRIVVEDYSLGNFLAICAWF
jgi:hypothetical protein